MIGVVSNKLLEPHPWHLGQSPPPLEPHAASHPLLLLIDSRDPLQAAVGEAHIAILSREERERHRAYRFPADRQRFLLAHASLRVILGRWLGISPRLITIEPGRQGKPHCLNAGAPLFNLSHSGDLILLGFHPTLEVGVDVEQARPNINWLPIARRVLMKILYAARMAKPDLLRATCYLATKVTRSDSACDKLLHRLVCYIHSSMGRVLTGWVGDGPKQLELVLYTDADFAGDKSSHRSTSGAFMARVGPRTFMPLVARIKKQSCASHSTPEAEILSVNLALRTLGMLALLVWDLLLGRKRALT